MNLSSRYLQEVVDALSSLPGIGKKTALRLALHLHRDKTEKSARISASLDAMRSHLTNCQTCFNLADQDTCSICLDARRDRTTLCIVESVVDLLAIEETDQYRGVFHVLGGVISPLEGVGPDDLNVAGLILRIQEGEVSEIIMAISPTIEGETTIYYLSKLLSEVDVKITQIARGVSFGGELEYADSLTLGRSIEARTPYLITLE